MLVQCNTGLTQISAEHFFDPRREVEVRRLIDTRLKPGGQLSGFAKGADLAWFLRVLNDCDYVHEPRLAPTADILADYRKDHRWDRYVVRFDALMDERRIASILDRAELATTPSCLLCSEHLPTRCHRRLVAERVGAEWQEFEVRHLT